MYSPEIELLLVTDSLAQKTKSKNDETSNVHGSEVVKAGK